MTKSFAFFREGLTTQKSPGYLWKPATAQEEDYAIDILNGYKAVDPEVRHFRRLETLPQPSGTPVSLLVPFFSLLFLAVCLMSNGAWTPAFLALAAAFALNYLHGGKNSSSAD